jgi:hypothetical protein
VTDTQPENPVFKKGSIAVCDILDDKNQPNGEQIEVTITAVRFNGQTPQSYRVHCKTPKGAHKYIWVKADFIHEKSAESGTTTEAEPEAEPEPEPVPEA